MGSVLAQVSDAENQLSGGSTSINSDSPRRLKLRSFPEGAEASKWTLYEKKSDTLVWHTSTKENAVIFFNISSKKIIKKLSLNNFFPTASPAYSEKHKTYYFLGREKEGKSSQNLTLFSYNLDKGIKSKYELDLYKLYNENFATELKGFKGIACKTRPLIIEDQLLFGCSCPTHYGKYRGVRGAIISLSLTKSLINSIIKPKIFFTSKVVKNKIHTGFNTGVYQLGSPPLIADKESVLIATGNGPTDIKNENYGCSLIRLNVKKMRVENPLLDSIPYSRLPFQECFHYNIDFAASSPVSIDLKPNVSLVAITSSNGVLVISKYNKKTKKLTELNRIQFGYDDTYGRANIVLKKDGTPRIIVAGTPRENLRNRNAPFLGTLRSIKRINLTSKELEEKTCVGYTPIKEEVGTFKSALYYSGNHRKNYVLAIESSKLVQNILSESRFNWPEQVSESVIKNKWAPFVKVSAQSVHLVDPNSYRSQYPNLKFKSLSIIADTYLHPSTSSLKTTNEKNLKKVEYENGAILVGSKTSCPSGNFPSLEKVYSFNTFSIDQKDLPDYKWYLSKSKGTAEERPSYWYLKAFDLDVNNKLVHAWTYSGAKNTKLPHSQFSTAIYKDKSVIYFPANPVGGSSKSLLLGINAQNGKEELRSTFDGYVHFTAPIIKADKIILPTVKGIRIFETSSD